MRRITAGLVLTVTAVALLTLLVVTCASATSVTLILEDQYGQELSGSMIHIVGVGDFPSGTSAEIPEGTHTVMLWPTFAGGPQPVYLARHEYDVAVTGGTTELRFEWRRSQVLYSIVDQTGDEITDSYLLVKGLGGSSVWHKTGDVVWLPITDESVYPTISGIFTDGYDFTVIPAFAGGAVVQKLARYEYGVEVTDATTLIQFEWQRAYELCSVVTQHGTEITGSFIGFVGLNSSWWLETGQVLPLPVTDTDLYPNIHGDYADGYDFRIMPYWGTAAQLWLSRPELAVIIDAPSVTGTEPLRFEWLSAECELLVVREDGSEIEGSLIEIVHDYVPTGSVVVLPTTDETVYPSMSGQVVDGFGVAIYPGGGGYGRLSFEVYPTPAIDAEMVEIGGQLVTLALGDCLGATGTIAGTVSNDTDPLPGVTVDLSDDGGVLIASAITGLDVGAYSFGEVDAGAYTVEVVLPLGYTAHDGYPLSVPVSLQAGDALTVDFNLDQVVATAEARSAGYWKHQYKVLDSGKGHAHESLADLEVYQQGIYDHFYARPDDYAIQIDGLTHSGSYVLAWEDALGTLSASGNSGMAQKAYSQFLALLLNVASQKIGQYHPVTADGMTVSQTITYVAGLLEDEDTSNDELAKDIAEQVNQNHEIADGTIPANTPAITYGPGQQSTHGIVFSMTPNPAAERVEISYSVPSAGSQVELAIYDLSGRVVRRLAEGHQGMGSQRIVWLGDDEAGNPVAPGVYFYRLRVNGKVKTLKGVKIR